MEDFSSLGPFEMLQKQSEFRERQGKWLMQEHELLVEQGVGNHIVECPYWG